MTGRGMSRKISCGFVAICALTLSGCGHSNSIIGKWRAASGENAMVWNFESGGSITQGGMRGRYRFVDDERIKIETPFATAVYRFQLSGDRLTLIDTNGAKLEFARVKETGR